MRNTKTATAEAGFAEIPDHELQQWAGATREKYFAGLVGSLVEIHKAGKELDTDELRRLARQLRPRMLKRIASNASGGAARGNQYEATSDAYRAIRYFFEHSDEYHQALARFTARHQKPKAERLARR